MLKRLSRAFNRFWSKLRRMASGGDTCPRFRDFLPYFRKATHNSGVLLLSMG